MNVNKYFMKCTTQETTPWKAGHD